VERILGRPFRLPCDLETVMPSFRGSFSVTEDVRDLDRARSAMSGRRTYWHLEGARRSRATTRSSARASSTTTEARLRGERPVSAPGTSGIAQRCPLAVSDWERFRDPRETTYRKYTELQAAKETFVDELLNAIEETGDDARLDPAWLEALATHLSVLRYPFHRPAVAGRVRRAAGAQRAAGRHLRLSGR
jgi:hypothetical protein